MKARFLFASLCLLSTSLLLPSLHSQENLREERLAEFLKKAPASDANGDGTLTLEEWQAFMTKRNQEMLKRFPQADANEDGTLTREELQAFSQARRERANAARPMTTLPPTHADVKYGDHELQAFDILRIPRTEKKRLPFASSFTEADFEVATNRGFPPTSSSDSSMRESRSLR